MALPVELIIRILGLLSFKDVVICSGVSRQFYEIVETSTSLQYIVELGLAGLVDSGEQGLTMAERLYRLREHEDSWLAMSWKSTSRIPVGRKYICWEICGGLFVGSYKVQITPPRPRAFDSLDIFELGPQGKDGPPDAITLERRFCSFSIDPGQDLLILVEDPSHRPSTWVVHIRSLSEGLSHINAARSTIEIPVAHQAWGQNDPGVVDIQILGSTVVYSQRRGPGLSGSISAFDWTTGNVTFMIYPVLGDWYGALISENELLVAQRPSFRSQPRLELYDLHPGNKWQGLRITYLLPFEGIEKIWRPEACYGPASYSAGRSVARPSRPFVPPRGPTLLAFRFACPVAPRDTSPPSNLDMFVLPEMLKQHGRTGDAVSWEVWGPQSTRWFRDVLPTNWRRNIHGYRAIIASKNSVLDFNANLWTEGDEGVVTQPSHIPLSASGANHIVSFLPYRTLLPDQGFGFSEIMLDDDLVCIERALDDIGMIKAFRILHF